ncbi:MAG: PleD family two-component system response regulator [Pseudomonadales bacterium]
MPDIRCKVMIVEDAVENRKLLKALLEDDYEVAETESAEECLERLGFEKPDLILMDVQLPGIDGYEACRKLKAQDDTRDLPIIFVSGGASTEERLAGYEAGGDEYVTKPFSVHDLLEKVERSLLTKQEEVQLKKTISEAQEVAHRALISSTELGGLNLYMQQCGAAQSYQELADYLLRAVRAFGLHCSVAMRAHIDTLYFGCEEGSLEADLLAKARPADGLVQLQARMLLNSQNCAILVKGMPLDKERNEQLHQYLSVILDATTARINTLQVLLETNAQRNSTIKNLIRTNELHKQKIQDKYQEREATQQQILSELHDQVEQKILRNLAEHCLMSSIDEGIRRINDLPDLSKDIESSFNSTKAILNRLLD